MEEKNTINPLVSIIVITYNSSKYVLDTLESVKAQTYQNIELIISDDGSKDDTVQICKSWLKENGNRFVRKELLTVKKNTGTVKNCLRGISLARGEWVKPIAGDDLFLPSGIKFFIEFLNSKSEDIHIVQSSEIRFVDNEDQKSFIEFPGIDKTHPIFLDSCDSNLQFQWLICGKLFSGASLYFRRETILNFENLEGVRFVEDFLFSVLFTFHGYKVFFLEDPTVMYRRHSESITLKHKNIYPFFHKEVLFIKFHYLRKSNFNFSIWIMYFWDLFFYKLICIAGNKGLTALAFRHFSIFFSPLRILKYFLK